MKDLIELASIVTKSKLRPVELVGGEGDSSSKIQQLYDMLQEGAVREDEEAAQQLYGTGKEDRSYQKLRGRLKGRLINSLFLIDLKQASYKDRQVAYYECYREWAAAKILFGKKAHGTAAGISRKLLKIARHFEFTELTVDILHTLRLYYGTIEGNFKQYKKYNTDFRLHQELWLAENRAEELYVELTVGYVNAKATRLAVQKKARAFFKEIAPSLHQHNAYQLHLYGRLIEASQYASANDYEHTLDVCERAIKFFEDKAYDASLALQIFYYQKLICHLQLREFDKAAAAAIACEGTIEKGSFNWFKLYGSRFLLCMHSRQYEQAYQIVSEVFNNSNYENMPENVKETWMISEAFLYFLQEAGQLSYKSRLEHFKPARFFNDLSVFPKDKQGMNIPIVLLEMLLCLAEGKHDRVMDRMEALDKYRTRHLRNPETQRSNAFMRMLLRIPKNAFNIKIAKEQAQDDYEQLKSIPIEIANQAYQIEVVPYEDLWDILTSSGNHFQFNKHLCT